MKRNNDAAFEKHFDIARDIDINHSYTSLQRVRNKILFNRKTMLYYIYNNGNWNLTFLFKNQTTD